jgi:hypothetical protein
MKLAKLLCAALFGAFTFGVVSAEAAPKGLRGDDIGKKLFNFNIIVYPNEDWSADDTVCPNNGNRVFFSEDGDHLLGEVLWKLDDRAGGNTSFDIVDCDGTADERAVIEANHQVDILVAIRVHGPASSSVGIVCQEVIPGTTDPALIDDLCVIDEATIKKGKSFTRVIEAVVNDE